MNLLTYIFMITVAVGSFFVYTNPHYKSVQALQEEAAEYESALVKAEQAEQLKAELAIKRETFTEEDVEYLHKMLPDTVDNIRLLLDINQIAAGYGSTISGIRVDTKSSDQAAKDPGAPKMVYGNVAIGFSVTMSYTAFLSFLKDLERNLRITDLTVLGFSSAETNTYTYNVSLRTYWLQ